MSQDVMKGISKYIGTIGAIKHLNLTWFGGEPLMAVPEIRTAVKTSCDKNLKVFMLLNLIRMPRYVLMMFPHL